MSLCTVSRSCEAQRLQLSQSRGLPMLVLKVSSMSLAELSSWFQVLECWCFEQFAFARLICEPSCHLFDLWTSSMKHNPETRWKCRTVVVLDDLVIVTHYYVRHQMKERAIYFSCTRQRFSDNLVTLDTLLKRAHQSLFQRGSRKELDPHLSSTWFHSHTCSRDFQLSRGQLVKHRKQFGLERRPVANH